MLDIAPELRRWIDRGREFAVATVLAVTGSAPRPPGAAMAVDTDGTVIGSVSGGCVEGAVYELCRTAMADGRPVVERFGYSDADAFAVGLTCGGVIDVLVTPVRADAPAREVFAAALAAADAGGAAALVRVTDGPVDVLGGALLVRPDGGREGALGGDPRLDAAAAAAARALLDAGRTGTATVGADGSHCGRPVTLLVESSVPPPRMIVFGATDHASELVRIGAFLGYRVTVCDARPVFATRSRFPEAEEVVVDWPHRYLEQTPVDRRTVLCVLTHDAKFDVPLLRVALRLPVGYVGALGSRRTHEDRCRRLREAGVTGQELARLRSPIGLDLGARTPQETAVSIAAEIVALRRGGSGLPLTGAGMPIHHDAPDARPEPAAGRPRVLTR
ncbi:XdhC family protein [Marinitenerispora sediminis]|uniref:XshC-Cox1-family protein n=1 Tax=Marinitenerispora sediminis TaxID=1931232 RepID=A0A368T3S9_9ACTN|nr:XdhC/CoxI family protein [Marinitenerispora sediminis]RCV49501.1 XshC-Cox1-family protein [Marinitenerispora sediminis]RCV52596.1 XshC-Cox1-family protein [Marinitenerispora sediminis]RCV56870.1 XshC-Cox1-family protein [Marinitenerispora sediminis]